MHHDRTPTGSHQDTERTAMVTVTDAARHLGLTPDAVRSRLHHGTLAGVKVGGIWRVALTEADAHADQTATGTQQPVMGTRQDTDRTPDSALVEQLRAENASLRTELSERSRELAAERDRADVLLREVVARLEALTAGTVDDDAPRPGGAGGGGR